MSDQTLAAAALYDALGRGANHDVETIAKHLAAAECRGLMRAADIATKAVERPEDGEFYIVAAIEAAILAEAEEGP